MSVNPPGLGPVRPRPLLVTWAMLALAVGGAGCATTIVVETTTSTTPPTTIAPRGDMVASLDNIVASAGRIGALVADGETDAARAELTAARENWAVLEPMIIESGIDAVESVQSIVDLMTTAVDRRRPADADKAYRFGLLILESFIERRG